MRKVSYRAEILLVLRGPWNCISGHWRTGQLGTGK